MTQNLISFFKQILFKGKDRSRSSIVNSQRGAFAILREMIQLSNLDMKKAINDVGGWEIAIKQIDEFLSQLEYGNTSEVNTSEVIVLPGNGNGTYRILLIKDGEELIARHVDIVPQDSEKEFRIKLFC